MGKRFCETVRRAGRWRGIVVLSLFACLAVAGCAQRDNDADQGRHNGFYGGVSAGAAMQ